LPKETQDNIRKQSEELDEVIKLNGEKYEGTDPV